MPTKLTKEQRIDAIQKDRDEKLDAICKDCDEKIAAIENEED